MTLLHGLRPRLEQSLTPTLFWLWQSRGLMGIRVDLSPGYFSGSNDNYQRALLLPASRPAPPHRLPKKHLAQLSSFFKCMWGNVFHESASLSGVITQEDVALRVSPGVWRAGAGVGNWNMVAPMRALPGACEQGTGPHSWKSGTVPSA